MLFENINWLLHERGAEPLSYDRFLRLSPDDLWAVVEQLGYPFETLNTTDLEAAHKAITGRSISLVVLDVDGVLTDGGMYYDAHGVEQKRFYVRDGLAITKAVNAGKQLGIISAAIRSEVTRHRAGMLGIQHIYIGQEAKILVLEEWLYKLGIGFENVAYVGDDINDLAVLQKVAVAACPADAAPAVQKAVSWVLHNKGGKGCVREFLERLYPDVFI